MLLCNIILNKFNSRHKHLEAILIVGTLHQSFTDSVFEFAEVALRKKTLIQCFDKIGVEQSDDIERRKDIESYRFNL